MDTVHYKGIPVHYKVHGKGKAVVLLHGFLEDLGMWDGLLPHLPAGYQYICIDLPGHGQTASLAYIHSMEEMAELVKKVLDELRLRRYRFIGHSMGGYVALAFADKYPDTVRSLMLLHSTSRADSDEKKAGREQAIALVKKDKDAFIRHSLPNLFSPKNKEKHRKIIDKLIEDASKMSVQGIVAALEGMKIRPDREVILHFAPYPCYLVAGKEDAAVPRADIEEQMKIPALQSFDLDCGHMGHIEQTEEVVEVIRGFLGRN